MPVLTILGGQGGAESETTRRVKHGTENGQLIFLSIERGYKLPFEK